MPSLSMPSRQRPGFTIIELLVAIMMIAILLTLLLPAIQQGRVSARTLQCKNNMRQIGLALQSYHTDYNVLPPGMFNYLGDDITNVVRPDGTTGLLGPSRSCWMQRLLPYVDQQPLYSKMPFDSNTRAHLWGTTFGTPIWTIVPQFMCPSDPASPKNLTDQGATPELSQGFHGNIVLCAASTEFGLADQFKETGKASGDDLNGLFYSFSSTRFADVSDGLSNTVMGSELILNPDGVGTPNQSRAVRDTRGRYYNCYRGSALFSTQYPPNTSVPDAVENCVANPASPCVMAPGPKVQYARSYHTGGANVMLADGSVRFVSETVSTEVFRALGSRAEGEPLGDF